MRVVASKPPHSNFAKQLCLSASLAFLMSGWAGTSYAQTADLSADLKASVVQLAEKIEQNDFTIKPTSSDMADVKTSQSKLIEQERNALYDAVFTGDKTLISKHFKAYKSLVSNSGNQRDIEVGNLFSAFLQNFSLDRARADYDIIIDNISPYLQSEDWFVSVQAYGLKTTLEAISVQGTKSLESAQNP